MSEPHLPEDVNRWPRDPFQLLGVQPGVSARELRRAYTQLIRIYKPEQSPEQFRRIREAYDFIQHYALYYAPPPEFVPPSETDTPDVESVAPHFTLDASPSPPAVPLPPFTAASRPDPDDEVDRLWDLGCAGDMESAYFRLRELYQRQPQNSGLVLRLYWLLEAAPELDPVRQPSDWLVTGLRAQGLMGPFRELYRRVIEGNPTEAFSNRFTDLLCMPVPPQQLLDLVAWRWRAATQIADWEIIANDLDLLRMRCLREDEDAWGRILILAADQLAWRRNAPAAMLFRNVCAQLEEMTHVHQRLAYELTQIDVLLDLAAQWKVMSERDTGLAPLLDLVPLSWTRPLSDFRPALLAYLGQIARNPQQILERFSSLAYSAPVLLGQFGRILQVLQFDAATPQTDRPSPDSLARQLGKLLAEANSTDYHVFRQVIFQYCLRETIAVEDATESAIDDPHFRAYQPLFQSLYEDWALRYVCQANRLFWSW